MYRGRVLSALGGRGVGLGGRVCNHTLPTGPVGLEGKADWGGLAVEETFTLGLLQVDPYEFSGL